MNPNEGVVSLRAALLVLALVIAVVAALALPKLFAKQDASDGRVADFTTACQTDPTC